MRPGSRAALALWLLLALVAILAMPQPAAGGGKPAPPSPMDERSPAAPPNGDIAAASPALRLLEVINQVRWQHGQLSPLKANPALERAAQAHSQSMAQNDFFGHKGDDLTSPWDRIDAAGYGNWYVLAENIAAGYKTPQEVVQAWMDSPHHRENLLNADLAEAGIGYAWQPGDTFPGLGWGYQHYWTLDMGTRWDAFPLVIAGEAYSTTVTQVSIYLYGQGWAREMRLSNDGTTWSQWQPYQSTRTWELAPGAGTRRVYGQLRNAQGEILQTSDDIVLVEKPVPPAFVSPAQVVFVVQRGQSAGQPPFQRLQIAEACPTTCTWQASVDRGWLRLSALSGTSPTTIALTLTTPVRLLPPGTYTATISVLGQEGSRAQVPVQLIIAKQVYSAYLPHVSRRR